MCCLVSLELLVVMTLAWGLNFVCEKKNVWWLFPGFHVLRLISGAFEHSVLRVWEIYALENVVF